MDENWRPILGFPRYMVNQHGEVRNANTGKLLVPVMDRDGRYYIRLYRNGKTYNRGVRAIKNRAFPSVDPHDIMGDWKEIPGFENYEISKYGEVRFKTTERKLKIQGTTKKYVNLYKNYKGYSRSINGLMRLVHGKEYRF